MKNNFLKYLLDNNPDNVLSPFGVTFRKVINPILRNYIAPLTSKKINITLKIKLT